MSWKNKKQADPDFLFG